MAFDGNKPALTGTKTSVLSTIRDNFNRFATLFQGGAGDSNIPTNAKRIDNDGKAYYWNGSVWTALPSNVDDTAYGAGWNGDTDTPPSKNAVYDAIQAVGSGGPNHVETLSNTDNAVSTITATTTTTNIGASATYLRATVEIEFDGVGSGSVTFVKATGGTAFLSVGHIQHSSDSNGDNSGADKGTHTILLDAKATFGYYVKITANRTTDSNIGFKAETFLDAGTTPLNATPLTVAVLLEAYI